MKVHLVRKLIFMCTCVCWTHQRLDNEWPADDVRTGDLLNCERKIIEWLKQRTEQKRTTQKFSIEADLVRDNDDNRRQQLFCKDLASGEGERE